MKKRFWSRIVLVTGVIVAVSCMLIVLFYGSLKRQLSMERSSNLDRLSEKVCDSFNILIEGQWNQVKSGARALRTLSPDTEDGLGFTVGQLERLLGYEEGSLSLIDSKGFRYQSQGVRMRWDVLEMLAPEQPASQVLITTPGLLDEAEEQILFMYRLKEPCYTGDGAVEITHLVLMKDMVSFGEAISTKTSALGNGSSYIVNQNGTVVYHQVFCSDFGTAYNILPLLKDAQFLYEDSFEQLSRDMAEGRSGTLEFQLDGQRWFVSYHNAQVNSWYILQLIPSSVLGEDSKDYLASVFFYIMSIALLICALVIYYVVAAARARLRQEEEAKTAMQLLADEARMANQAKTDFLSSMSHDIRTPMNGIVGMTEVAKRNMEDQDKVRECLDKITVASDHLLSLINDTLDMNRIEQGKMQIEHSPFDLKELLDDCATLITAQLESRDVEFISDYGQLEHIHLLGHAMRIRQVLINILGNSVKFTPDGGQIAIRVTELKAENGRAFYEVICSDTGIGMSPEFLDKLFSPFEQEIRSARSNHMGTGLGMAIAHSLVELMGGRMEVRSVLNQGTVFTLHLDFDIDETAKDMREEVNTVDLTGMKILLADDNELNREIAEDLLSDEGIEVIPVTNGREALETFAAEPPGTFDAILMDVMMPEMDGLEACRAIRGLDRADAKTIPILAMTANAYQRDIQKTKEVGMDEHLSKPLNLKLVLETLMKYRSGTNRSRENDT